jgi:uncharacterized protein (TIGR02757 family)
MPRARTDVSRKVKARPRRTNPTGSVSRRASELPRRPLSRSVRRHGTILGEASAERLRPRLESFLERTDVAARIGFDPVELPRRFSDPRDVEVVALLSACLAYGRADLFKPKLEALLEGMGPSPSRFVAELDVRGAARLLGGFVYRFNVATDLAALLLGTGRALRERGSLEAVFAEELRRSGTLRGALEGFAREIRSVPMEPIRKVLGPERGLDHLLPARLGLGAAKRLNLFLRWMVRGPDAVDFGIWRSVPPSVLVIPLDTHVARMARNLRLTARRDLGWRTAEEVTASLRRLDPIDPVKYDFALCHYGMSGMCPTRPIAANCAKCLLLPACRVGPAVVRRAGVRPHDVR